MIALYLISMQMYALFYTTDCRTDGLIKARMMIDYCFGLQFLWTATCKVLGVCVNDFVYMLLFPADLPQFASPIPSYCHLVWDKFDFAE